MSPRTFVVVAVLAAALVQAGRGDAAPCVTACRDEIAACMGSECQGLTHRPLRHCKHQCKRSIVRDCFADLSVCGATSARPVKPTSGGGGGGGGGGTTGGW
jgi:uncharacterized membrane protein YgcG